MTERLAVFAFWSRLLAFRRGSHHIPLNAQSQARDVVMAMLHLPTGSLSQSLRETEPRCRETVTESVHVVAQRCRELKAGQGLFFFDMCSFMLEGYTLASQCWFWAGDTKECSATPAMLMSKRSVELPSRPKDSHRRLAFLHIFSNGNQAQRVSERSFSSHSRQRSISGLCCYSHLYACGFRFA